MSNSAIHDDKHLTIHSGTAKEYIPEQRIWSAYRVSESSNLPTRRNHIFQAKNRTLNFEPTRTEGIGFLPGSRIESAVTQLPLYHEVESTNMSATEQNVAADANPLNRAEAKKAPTMVVNDPSYDKDPHATADATLSPPQPSSTLAEKTSASFTTQSNTTTIAAAAATLAVPGTLVAADDASIIPIPPTSTAASSYTTETDQSAAAAREIGHDRSSNGPVQQQQESMIVEGKEVVSDEVAAREKAKEEEHQRRMRNPPEENTHAFSDSNVNVAKSEEKPRLQSPIYELTPEEKAAKEKAKEEERERRRREPPQERTHAFPSPINEHPPAQAVETNEAAGGNGDVKGYGRKSSLGQKLKGEVKIIAGKLTGDAKKVEEGRAMLQGTA
ncbi:hypothetical protein M422DRAFT_41577 [Sphaerobolus stellatus SS14]|nr:hypothetical protein M422DRAFT_41577 [Sphaerobolus stellatus SS14]